MRIAILTLPLHTNYGGILQAYALQSVLQRMGHEVVHLQPVHRFRVLHPAWKMPLVWMKRCILKCFDSWEQPVFEHPDKFVRKNTDVFIHQHLDIRELDDEEWNETLAPQYEAFLVGSDQVWRSAYAFPLSRFFLSFLPSHVQSLRVAYAASFGQDPCDLSNKQIAECIPCLQRFRSVSVREESGVRICKEQFQIAAQQVLDPTMLLRKEDYLALANQAKPSPGNLMVYVLDESPRVNQWIDKMTRLSGLQLFRMNSKVENPNAKLTDRLQPPVEQWLRGFADAEYVLTDSFHGCVFSIIFGKPFLCIGNSDRGLSRFHSLFRQFGLEHCLVSLDQTITRLPSPDWSEVQRRLEVARRQSMLFLSLSLKR